MAHQTSKVLPERSPPPSIGRLRDAGLFMFKFTPRLLARANTAFFLHHFPTLSNDYR